MVNAGTGVEKLFGHPVRVNPHMPAGAMMLVPPPSSFRMEYETIDFTTKFRPPASFEAKGVVDDEALQQEFDEFDPKIKPGLIEPPSFPKLEKRYLERDMLDAAAYVIRTSMGPA